MARTILCTSGTSIAQGCGALIAYQGRASHWADTAEDLAAQVRLRILGLDLLSERDRTKASAELNALHRLQLAADDEVVLLATDTADGRCCAEAVREVLVGRAFGLPEGSVRVERVVGLQVRDAARLRSEGLVNLVRLLITYLEDPQRRYGGGCVLCPNGGFKGVVPFMTILGMLHRAPVVYVFEFAESLITLPPLPFGFATDLFERALPALRWAGAEGVFDPEDFYRRIAGFVPDERELFDGFLELASDDKARALASLSPLAEVLRQREGGPQAELMVSSEARDGIQGLEAATSKDVTDHLTKLASPLWRSQHRDRKHTNDLDFYPRGHNPWRFAGFDAGGLFYLCWFARHDEYIRQMPLAGRQRSAFIDQDFSLLALAPPQQPAIADSDPDANLNWLEIRAQRDEARQHAAKLTAALAEAAAASARERAALSAAVSLSRQEADSARRELLTLQDLMVQGADAAAVDAEPACEQPENLNGQVVSARLVEERPRSCIFERVAGELPPLLLVVARAALSAPPGDGPVQLRILGHDGKRYQAAPIQQPCGAEFRV